LALWGERGPLRVVRADAGFFDKDLFTFLEERGGVVAVSETNS
jgi:hypothetical protein